LHEELKEILTSRIIYFTTGLGKYPVLQHHWIESRSTIQVINIGGNARTKFVATQLQHAGYDVRAILSPTVKEGEERLRICLHVYNTEKEISGLLYQLNQAVHSFEKASILQKINM
jgi:8-amino-7-oxononanoate synthase